MRFELKADYQIVGNLLVQEIKAATGLDVSEKYSFYPPRFVDVSDEFEARRDEIGQVVTQHNPDLVALAKAAALDHLNTWRGQRRAALGLTSAAFQELVYSGKFLMVILWLYDQATGAFFSAIASYVAGLGLPLPQNFGQFPCHAEAEARGLSDVQMALLVLAQGFGWLGGSDAIEATYITSRTAIENASNEAEVAAALLVLEQ